MTFFVKPAQDSGMLRDAAPQLVTVILDFDSDAPISTAMMPAMPVSAMVRFVLAALAAGGHGGAAFGAELRTFRQHAGRDLRHIGDDVGAQSHGVRRASLLGLGATLSVCPIGWTEQRTGQQGQQASKTHDSHVSIIPGFRNLPGKGSGDVRRRRWIFQYVRV
jgi:hypothetical protein